MSAVPEQSLLVWLIHPGFVSLHDTFTCIHRYVSMQNDTLDHIHSNEDHMTCAYTGICRSNQPARIMYTGSDRVLHFFVSRGSNKMYQRHNIRCQLIYMRHGIVVLYYAIQQ